MAFRLGTKSKTNLKGVHPDLVAVVERAIQLTSQDFQVTDGIRTIEEQRIYVKKGTSKTMKSLHLPQKDGHGHAVDLVPYIEAAKGPVWEGKGVPAAFKRIETAMWRAAKELKIDVRRIAGGLVPQWDSPHWELPASYRKKG